MNITYGKYDATTKKVHELSAYYYIPSWITQIIHTAAVFTVHVPTKIVICPRDSPYKSNVYGTYLYIGKNGDIVDTAICFTYRVQLYMRQYTLAHEIGHCDHWKNGLILPEEEAEKYAHNIAEKLTGIVLINNGEAM